MIPKVPKISNSKTKILTDRVDFGDPQGFNRNC